MMKCSTIPWLQARLQTHSLDALKQRVEFHIVRPNRFNNLMIMSELHASVLNLNTDMDVPQAS
jgi:hypothetical protein